MELQSFLTSLKKTSQDIEHHQQEVFAAVEAQSRLVRQVIDEVALVKHLAEKPKKTQETSDGTCGFCVSGNHILEIEDASPKYVQPVTLMQNNTDTDPTDLDNDGEEDSLPPAVSQELAEIRRLVGDWRVECEEEMAEGWDVRKALGFEASAEAVPAKKRTSYMGSPIDSDALNPISTSAQNRMQEHMSSFQRFVVSATFDQITGGMILLHSFCVGMAVNERALDPVSHCEGGLWVTVQFMCNILFTLELILRICNFGLPMFFCGPERCLLPQKKCTKSHSFEESCQHWAAAIGYLFFIALVAMAVLNVVTAVFVEYAMKMAAEDRDLVIQDYLDKQSKYAKAARAVFTEADADGSGTITFEEFTTHLQDVRVQAFLQSMELDGMEAVRLFRLLDADGNGAIEVEEFVSGCSCLKGMAKTMDLAMLLREQRKASRRFISFMSDVDLKLTQILSHTHHAHHHGHRSSGPSPKA
ncbi:unnamed protein product [Effrenium voratum]|nr:unnamed protein product [Effrenium voratum]